MVSWAILTFGNKYEETRGLRNSNEPRVEERQAEIYADDDAQSLGEISRPDSFSEETKPKMTRSELIRETRRKLIEDTSCLADVLSSRNDLEGILSASNTISRCLDVALSQEVYKKLSTKTQSVSVVEIEGCQPIKITDTKPIPKNTRVKRYANSGAGKRKSKRKPL